MNGLIWLFPVLCTVHNIDEGLTLPSYAEAQEKSILKNKRVFIGLIVFLTILAYAVTGLFAVYKTPFFSYLYFGYVGAMLINAFIPHITGSIMAKRPLPGLVTAIINALVFGYILVLAVILETISLQTLLYSTVIVGGAILCLMFFCFRFLGEDKSKQEA